MGAAGAIAIAIRVPSAKQERRRNVLGGAEGAIAQDREIGGHQVHEESFRLHRAGTFDI